MNERKLLIILITVFAIISAAILSEIWLNNGLAEGGEYFIFCKPGSRVNVRNKAKKSSSVTAWVECGQPVTVDGEKNGFVHVTGLASEEPDGWIFAGYIVDEEPVIETYRAEVWEGPVIVRKSVNGKQIRKLKDGQEVTVYAKTHMWAVTDKGFIMCDWLREKSQ